MVESKETIVADASVLVKWALNEPEDSKQATALGNDFSQGKLDIVVPTHFFSEIGNILGRKDPKNASQYFSNYKLMGLKESLLGIEVASIAFELMQRHEKISFYDAAYHALALKNAWRFITCDEKYFNQTRTEGNILLLRDYS